MEETIIIIYLAIGFALALNRVSKPNRGEDSSLLCIGAVIITVLWPLYLTYKHYKHENNRESKSDR